MLLAGESRSNRRTTCPSACQKGSGIPSLGINRPERKANISPPSSYYFHFPTRLHAIVFCLRIRGVLPSRVAGQYSPIQRQTAALDQCCCYSVCTVPRWCNWSAARVEVLQRMTALMTALSVALAKGCSMFRVLFYVQLRLSFVNP